MFAVYDVRLGETQRALGMKRYYLDTPSISCIMYFTFIMCIYIYI